MNKCKYFQLNNNYHLIVSYTFITGGVSGLYYTGQSTRGWSVIGKAPLILFNGFDTNYFYVLIRDA